MTGRLLLEARLASHGEVLHNAAWQDDPNSVWRRLIAVTEQGGRIPNLLYRGAGQAAGPTFIFAAMSAPNIWEAQDVGHLRHRRSRPQGRVRQLVGPSGASRTGRRFGDELPVQQRRSEPDHDARVPSDPLRRPESRAGYLRAGQMDVESSDPERRAPLRLLQYVLSGRHSRPRTARPDQELHDPQYKWYNWKDLSPRVAAVYDLFGNGKTALKANIGRYVLAGDPTVGNVFGRLANTVTRNWTDGNRNYIPDCDMLNLQQQDSLASGGDFCSVVSDLRFGQAIPSIAYDSDVLVGWGKRPYNWEFSAAVQHELTPRVALDVGFFRRWYGNFLVTDNRAVAGSDFSSYSVTAPSDSRLPDGGNYPVTGLYDLQQAGPGR